MIEPSRDLVSGREPTIEDFNVRCPWCGAIRSDSWELGDGVADSGTTECDVCERKFLWEREITPVYHGRVPSNFPAAIHKI